MTHPDKPEVMAMVAELDDTKCLEILHEQYTRHGRYNFNLICRGAIFDAMRDVRRAALLERFAPSGEVTDDLDGDARDVVEQTPKTGEREDEIARLRAALEPFAKFNDCNERNNPGEPDDAMWDMVAGEGGDDAIVTTGDFRRAREALSTKPAEEG